jgi:hypothetical protein
MEAPAPPALLNFGVLTPVPSANRVIIVLPFVSFSTNKEALF